MPDLHVNPVTVPLTEVGKANLEYSVEIKRNKFICCEETAIKMLSYSRVTCRLRSCPEIRNYP